MARTGTGRQPQRPHSMSQTPSSEHPRSVFDRSHSARLTCDTSDVVPVLCEEVLPGDTYSCTMHSFTRLATILRPVLDDLTMTAFFFFTANRLVWEHWAQFQGALDDPDDDITQYEVPTLTKTGQGWATGSIADYFGIPILIPNKPVNALPFRMHDLIFNEWFRDVNLQDKRVVEMGDGDGTGASGYTVPFKRGRAKDYLTGGLPFLQRGPPATIPLGTTAPVIPQITGNQKPIFTVEGGTLNQALHGTISTLNLDLSASGDATGDLIWEEPKLEVDLSLATSATINALRLSNSIQVLYERDARSGTRYPEQLYSQWGVTLPDAQWRPEYLGGGSQQITVNVVEQSSRQGATADEKALGQLAAYGTSHGRSGFQKSFSEHGWIIGYISTRQTRLAYQQALEKKWTRKDRVDYYIPALANLGEQVVKNEEIYLVDPDLGGSGVGEIQNQATFAFQERWAEYKYGTLSSIRGKFRSTASSPLEMYHYGLDFSSLPVLGDTFIQDDVPMDRILAISTEPHLLVDLFFDMKVTRVMPVYSTPSLMTRF